MSIELDNNNVLLILGNGFDLSCNCKTTYGDYFDYLNKIDVYKTIFINCDLYLEKNNRHDFDDIVTCMFVDKEVPLWTLYFYCVTMKDTNRSENWFDIENDLREFLVNRIDNLVSYLQFSIVALKDYDNIIILMGDIIKKRFDNIDWQKDEFAKRTLCNILLDDLMQFESDFSHYVDNNYNNTELYDANRRVLLNKILNAFLTINSLKICSFNYTHVPQHDDVYNIHGTCANPILGIDHVGENDTEISIFSKVNRQMSDERIMIPDDFLNGQTYTLVFFGLSFCQTDLDDIKTIASYLDSQSKIYVLYKKYKKTGKTYNPREDLLDSFKKFCKTAEIFNIKNDIDFSYAWRRGRIKFLEIE